tara:strand:- start:25738 stop:28503 length:2766 start_codon:yes stop_codon:yes gene_type:complete
MNKTYDPHAIEQNLYKLWEQQGYFKPSGVGQTFSIVIPPPNVTGSLHMGHGFQYTLMDALTRYHRMSGDNTLWQVGSDHAGIATQMVVERQLSLENKTRHDLGRETFLERVWDWKQESGGMITQQMRRLGISVDWERERFSMDEGLSDATVTAFEKLYDDGLIYRGKRLVNWDPKLHTAVSDLEVVNQEKDGHIWHLRYPLVDDETRHVIVATTRPETLFGDVAVAVNPNDERYQDLIGKHVKLPLTDRTIPIIADDHADPEFGTGCVKITPGHDFNDYEVGKRHDLPLINILTISADLNENVPMAYQGLNRFVARKQAVKELEEMGFLVEVKPHKLQIPRNERGNEILEPYLTEQWYVDVKPLAKKAIDVVRNGEVRFVPDNWSKTYFQWMENIQDWCISRQLWWGHRIPAWYDNKNNIYVGKDEAHVREKYRLEAQIELQQDDDVLDTWFSAGLWPFASLGWPQDEANLKTFFPTDVMITGFDIIFFWVARMIMFSLYFTDEVPFKDVYITGLIRDEKGQKMSKSKGNVLDPIDLVDGIDLESLVKKRNSGLMQSSTQNQVEKNTRKAFPDGIAASGTDALRFTYCALASTGRDIKFDLGRLEGYRNFCNKLWNATRFVLMNTEAQPLANKEAAELSLPDRWIVSRLEQTIEKAHDYFAKYRFDLLAQTLYEFVWNDYCDWYLELTKPILNNDDYTDIQKSSTRLILLEVLENILRLLHPLMPYITESIWQQVKPLLNIKADTIMLQPYPEFDVAFVNNEALEQGQWLQQAIIGVRNIRGEMNISPNKTLPLFMRNGSEQDKTNLAHTQSLLTNLAKLESITWLEANDEAPAAATALVGNLELLIPLAGLIDKAAESARLEKEIKKLTEVCERSDKKLSNPGYTDKAPAQVVQKERDKLAENQAALDKLREKLGNISAL